MAERNFELNIYSKKFYSLLDVYVKVVIIKLYINLNSIDLTRGQNLYWLCSTLHLNYSYSLGLIHKFEDWGLIVTALVGREIEIVYTEKGLELSKLLINFCNVFVKGLEV